ncbi:MAG: hypothetical protein FJ009_06155 [Chloroflexi bacterium]|nr:hypothetical protein [Chloroflexota bacterium]
MGEIDIHFVAKQIATIMGWEFDDEQQSWSARIIDPKSELMLYVHDERGRIRISAGFGMWRDFLTYNQRNEKGRHEIGVSVAKSIEQIVKDIHRRLLPKCLADLAEAKVRHAEYNANVEAVMRLTKKFADLLGVKPPEKCEGETTRLHLPLSYGVYGTINITLRDVKIDLDDIPHEIAAQVLIPIQQHHARVMARRQVEKMRGMRDDEDD